MQKTLKIGLISKPQGINGELKIYPLTDDVSRFAKLKEVLIDGKSVRLEKSKACGTFAVIKIFGVNDRNSAETYRGKFIEVSRENAVKLEKDRYFIADLIGMDIYAGDEFLGKIVDVTEAKTDYVTAESPSGKIFRFPFLKDLLISVDVSGGEMRLKEERFKEVSYYED